MAIAEPLVGRYVELRSCTVQDAEFTRCIRRDAETARFLPRFDNTLEEQIAWIRNQRERPGDYFFVVWDKDENRIGTIGIYDVNGNRAESGRLVIQGRNPFQPLEAQMLSFRFAFDVLGLECVYAVIYSDNPRAIRFNRQFGGKHFPPKYSEEKGHEIIPVENWREDFRKAEKALSSVLYREKRN